MLPGGQTVSKADTALGIASSHTPSVFGQPVTFTATVGPLAPGAGAPSGQVQFGVDGVDIGSPVSLSGGVGVSAPIAILSAGTHAVTAIYAGDASFNLSAGTLGGGQVVLDSGAALLVPARTEGRVLVVIHPRAVGLYRSRPEGSPRNVWLARVEDIDPEGELVRVRLGGDTPVVAELTRAAREELALVPGAEVWASVKATEIAVYPT